MRAAVVCLAVLALSGCERAMQDMYDQPRYRQMQAAPDGSATVRLPPPGALARDQAPPAPRPIDAALLREGRERFAIYCQPCHGAAGDGQGLIPSRGFPHPPSYHTDRLRAAPDRHFYDVMTDGYGIMYSYADRVSPEERWAIVAYIRALQLSQHARAADLPPETRAKLDTPRTERAR